jgi:hypothetical protein
MQFRSLLIRLNFYDNLLKESDGAYPFFFKSSSVIMAPIRIIITTMAEDSGMLGVGEAEEGEVEGATVEAGDVT